LDFFKKKLIRNSKGTVLPFVRDTVWATVTNIKREAATSRFFCFLNFGTAKNQFIVAKILDS